MDAIETSIAEKPTPTFKRRLGHSPDLPIISPDIASGLGYVAIGWSGVEDSIGALVRSLLKLDGLPALSLCVEMPFQAQVNLATVLLNLSKAQEIISDWRTLSLQMDSTRATRNFLIHGTWYPFLGAMHGVAKSKAKQRLTTEFEPYNYSMLLDFANECVDLSNAINEFTVLILKTDVLQRIHAIDAQLRDGFPAQRRAHNRGSTPIKKVRGRTRDLRTEALPDPEKPPF